MTEFYTQPSPLELLERDHPELIKSSIIASDTVCTCGSCNMSLTLDELETLDRCSNLDCGAVWMRVLATVPYPELPMKSFRHPIISARKLLEIKQEKLPTRNPVLDGLRRRSIATVAVDHSFL